MLTLEEAADYCGLSANSFRAYVRISPTNFGRAVRYDRVAIDKVLDDLCGVAELPRPNRILQLAGNRGRRARDEASELVAERAMAHLSKRAKGPRGK